MTVFAREIYNQKVIVVVRRGLVMLFAVLSLTLSLGAFARADDVTTTTSPVLWVNLGGGGNLTVRTWDRDSVAVDGDPTIQVNHPRNIPPERLADFFRQYLLRADSVQGADGAMTLPAEPFPIPPLSDGPHDAVLVRGSGNVTITVPQDTAIVEAQVSRGSITVNDYHGTLLSQMNAGQMHLNNVSGTAALQLNNGPLVAQNSTFDRLRVRTGRGTMFFGNCHVTQIQATSLTGNIVYDNGSFEPGLARFESQQGSVAIGVANDNAQFLAHSQNGRIVGGDDVPLQRNGADAQGSLSHSGPIVSASSTGGNVIFYRGSLANKPALRKMLPQRATRPLSRPRPFAPFHRPGKKR